MLLYICVVVFYFFLPWKGGIKLLIDHLVD